MKSFLYYIFKGRCSNDRYYDISTDILMQTSSHHTSGHGPTLCVNVRDAVVRFCRADLTLCLLHWRHQRGFISCILFRMTLSNTLIPYFYKSGRILTSLTSYIIEQSFTHSVDNHTTSVGFRHLLVFLIIIRGTTRYSE